MKVLKPLAITDAGLIYSNVPEDDAPTYDSGTTYAAEAEVILEHRVYRSVVGGNAGIDPRTDNGTNWLELGFTNRWRVFDQKVNNLTEQLDTIVYRFEFTESVSGIALLNLGAATIQISVKDGAGSLIYNTAVNRFEHTEIVDYWTFFTIDLSLEDIGDAIFEDVKGYPGNAVEITLSAVNSTSEVSVGQILLGPIYDLGTTLTNTTIGIRDFSSKDRDQFGNAIIIERAFADTTNFQFYLKTRDARRVRNILSGLRAYPSFYFASVDAVQLGAQTYGFFQDFEIPLAAGGNSFANLKVEGLS